MDIGEFLKQIPLTMLLMPIVLGAVYIILMVSIMRRSRKRKQAKLEAALAAAGDSVPPVPQVKKGKRGTFDRLGVGNFVRGELPERPMQAAAWTVPPELRDLPEPDLDMLAVPVGISDLDRRPATTVDPHENFYTVDPVDSPPIPAYPEPATVMPATATSTTSMPITVDPSGELDWLSALTPASPEQEAPMSTTTGQNPHQSADNSVPPPADAVEVLRVYRDLSDGKLIIQLGEGRYRTITDISNPDLLRRFTALVRELWNMITTPTGTGPLPAASEAPAVPIDSGMNSGMKKRMGLLNSTPAEPAKPQNQGFKGFGRSQPAPRDESQPGIVGAVEEFLQFKLSTTPQFATRTIHIRPSHDSGVRIEVDGHSYDSIGDIVDVDVREFLSSMMREWEARH